MAALAEQGTTPNLGRAASGWVSGRLRSTVHPNTPPAWVSICTGVNPAKHGVFDFRARMPGRYARTFVDSTAIRAERMWQPLGRAGLSVGLINIPFTYPPEPVNGFLIGGMLSPDPAVATHPAGLGPEIGRLEPGYRIEVETGHDRPEAFAQEALAMARARRRLAERLLETRRPDFFMVVFTATDRLQHLIWSQVEEFLSGSKQRSPGLAALLEIYREIDGFVERLVADLEEGDLLLIVSDHGFGPLRRDVCLNRFLADKGYLQTLPPGTARPRSPWWSGLDEEMREGLDAIDWARTRVYSSGYFGCLNYNLSGREPGGVVEPGPELARLEAGLIKDLLRLRDPDSGRLVVDQVAPAREIYQGPFLNLAPDLLVVMNNYAYMTRDGSDLPGRDLFLPPMTGHTGTHRLFGLFQALSGRGELEPTAPEFSVYDIAPTVLAWCGLPLSDELDGRALFGRADGRPVERHGAGTVPEGPSDLLEDRAAIEKNISRKMKNLGYLE